MTRPTRISTRQLALLPAQEEGAPPTVDDIREALVRALADLLLEALGEKPRSPRGEHGGPDES